VRSHYTPLLTLAADEQLLAANGSGPGRDEETVQLLDDEVIPAITGRSACSPRPAVSPAAQAALRCLRAAPAGPCPARRNLPPRAV